ncbi:MAG: flavodoxin [Treponema sp.]|nr:flavodoxin [Treponema sp.]
MSNTVIIYYSLEGNVDYIAKLLAVKTGADLIRLETVKEYPKKGLLKFITGGCDAMFGIRPALKNALPDFDQFSTIIIGTPVWAGKLSAPINTFLHKTKIKGKRIALFACCAGGQTEKCFNKMKQQLSENTILTCDTFINPMQNEGYTVTRKADMIASKL